MLLKRIAKYIYLKFKWKEKVRFSLSDIIFKQSSFEGMNQIYPNTIFYGHLGLGSYIAENCELINAKIGRFCSIAPNVKCNNGIHPTTSPFVSTAPCFYSLNLKKAQSGSSFAQKQMFKEYRTTESGYSLEVGNDVWICENVFLNGGIHIGDGAIILAGAVVTKDVPAYAVVGGVPAKVIKYRYDDETIQFLLSTKWWNNKLEWFKQHWKLLCNIEEFKQYYSEIDT